MVFDSGDAGRIEYNPNRPRERRRYSVAHEIAHTLFPDCAKRVRHRGSHHGKRPGSDDWQLEALCNIAAAEILMPVVGTLPFMDRSAFWEQSIPCDFRRRHRAAPFGRVRARCRV